MQISTSVSFHHASTVPASTKLAVSGAIALKVILHKTIHASVILSLSLSVFQDVHIQL